jgi:hypothetical protein
MALVGNSMRLAVYSCLVTFFRVVTMIGFSNLKAYANRDSGGDWRAAGLRGDDDSKAAYYHLCVKQVGLKVVESELVKIVQERAGEV